jgi:hypothetical protein
VLDAADVDVDVLDADVDVDVLDAADDVLGAGGIADTGGSVPWLGVDELGFTNVNKTLHGNCLPSTKARMHRIEDTSGSVPQLDLHYLNDAHARPQMSMPVRCASGSLLEGWL